jgi:hypothetical protein
MFCLGRSSKGGHEKMTQERKALRQKENPTSLWGFFFLLLRSCFYTFVMEATIWFVTRLAFTA